MLLCIHSVFLSLGRQALGGQDLACPSHLLPPVEHRKVVEYSKNVGSEAGNLSDLGQVVEPLSASVFLPVKWAC